MQGGHRFGKKAIMSRCPKHSRFESDLGKVRERRAVYRDFSCSRCCRRNTQLNCGAGRFQCDRPDGSDFSCEAGQSDRRRAVAHGQQLNFWDGPNMTANGAVDGGSGTWSSAGTATAGWATSRFSAFSETGADALNLSGTGSRDKLTRYGIGGFTRSSSFFAV